MWKYAVLVMAIGLLVLFPKASASQTVYHLHQETSALSTAKQLKTNGPDSAVVSYQSADLKNKNPQTGTVMTFETQTGVPGTPGSIPAGSVVSFSLWLKKTSNWGTFYPRAGLYLNSDSSAGLPICVASGESQTPPTTTLTTSLVKYTLICTVQTAVSFSSADRWYVTAGYNMTAGPNNHGVKVELDIEGALNGNYNSTITAPQVVPPPPHIVSLTPISGPIGASLTVGGSSFGASQGTSTVRVNGVVAPVTNWSATSITATIPAGSVTGPVNVTVNSQASNALTFQVTGTGSVTGTVRKASDQTFVASATVDVLQSGVLRASTTTNGSGQFSSALLTSGLYAVRLRASGFVDEIRTGIAVGGAPTIVDVALASAGTASGQVSDGASTPVPGVSVTASIGGGIIANAVSDTTGNYSMQLRPGTYTLEASAPGWAASRTTGVVIGDGGATTVDFSLTASTPSNVAYAYDDVGRLVGVTDASGDTVKYVYDATGNVTAITRGSSGQTSIITFSPNAGPIGTSVTVTGTGFGATPAQNTVTVNGTAAQVLSASATQLVITVPAGATTGSIAVTAPSGVATAGPFTVGAPPGAPTITAFSPSVVAPGGTFTVTGTNFQTNPSANSLMVSEKDGSVSSATATSLTAQAPSIGMSGHVRVTTPHGTAVSNDILFIPPSPYTVSQVVTTAVLAYDVPLTVTVSANGIGLVAFDVPANQRLTAFVENLTTTPCSVTVTRVGFVNDVWTENSGHSYANGPIGVGVSYFFDTFELPSAGTYQFVVSSCNSAGGAITSAVRLTIHPVPTDDVRWIVSDGPIVVMPLTYGQNGILKFSGQEGQRVALAFSGLCPSINPLEPNAAWSTTGGSFVQWGCPYMEGVLLSSGTYTLRLDPDAGQAGTLTAQMYSIPPDVTGTITPGGPSVVAANTAMGQNIQLFFEGVAGRHVALWATNCNYGQQVIIGFYKPDNTFWGESGFTTTSQFIDVGIAPVSGTYRIQQNPSAGNIGNCTLTLYDSVDVSTSIATDGSPVIAATTVPGQNAVLYFSGTAGQRLFLSMTNVTYSGCTLHTILYAPGGVVQATNNCVTSGSYLDTFTLSVSDIHAIASDPVGAGTGSATYRLYTVPPDASGSLTLNGPSVNVPIGTPGQNGLLTFSGTSGQATVRVTANTMGSVTVKLLKPDGSTMTSTTSSSASFNLATQTLPSSGTYSISVDPVGANTGSISINVTRP